MMSLSYRNELCDREKSYVLGITCQLYPITTFSRWYLCGLRCLFRNKLHQGILRLGILVNDDTVDLVSGGCLDVDIVIHSYANM